MFRFISHIPLRTLIPALIVSVSVVATVITAASNYIVAKNSKNEATQARLIDSLEERKSKIKFYFQEIRKDLIINANSPQVIEMTHAFTKTWGELLGDKEKYLKKAYITDNPFPVGEKEKLDFAEDNSAYSDAHKQYHPFMRNVLIKRGYYDIFLFDTKGNLIYSVFKEADYATNFIDGEYADSGLGSALRASLEKGYDEVFFSDYAPYAPSNNQPANFFSAPVFDEEKKNVIGVFAIQMPITEIDKIVTKSTGLGETGEIYLVGRDYLVRNNSRFSDDSQILVKKIKSNLIDAAFERNSYFEVSTDDQGREILATALPFTFEGELWAITSRITTKEANKSVNKLRNYSIIYILVISSFAGIIGKVIGSNIARQLSEAVDVMEHLAKGNLNVTIPEAHGRNAIFRILKALNNFKDSALEARDAAEERETENNKKIRHAEKINNAIKQFRTKSDAALSLVMDEAQSMRDAANTMSQAIEETNQLTKNVVDAAEQASENVNTVAGAAEELSSSILEISSQVQKSNEVANDAVAQTKKSDQLVQGLAESADRIGEVVTLINDIATQTNLLALNATIEAARAGDAGKGFAVVANEVKYLATQTGKATDEISDQIISIQRATRETVEAMRQITDVIADINNITVTITASVEEQGAATQEIAHTTQQTADGTYRVTKNINGVSTSVSKSSAETKNVISASDALRLQAENLRTEIDAFMSAIQETSEASADHTATPLDEA